MPTTTIQTCSECSAPIRERWRFDLSAVLLASLFGEERRERIEIEACGVACVMGAVNKAVRKVVDQ